MSWIKPISLQGMHVTLVPLELNHAPELIEAVNDGELWKLWYATSPIPENMSEEIQQRLNWQVQEKMLPFTVIDNKTQLPIGMTAYWDISEINKRLDIGYTWYRKSKQKTTANTETKLLLLKHAFENLNCNVVRFAVNFFNKNSCRAVERLGAKLDGIERNFRIMRNGAVCDFVRYSIIASEWPAVKINLEKKLNERS